MPSKGSIQPGAAMTNQFQVVIGAILPILATRVTGLDRSVKTANLPDQTWQSTGQVPALMSIEIDVPLHHAAEVLAMEGLELLTVTGAPLYKSAAFVYVLDASGAVKKTYNLIGFGVTGHKVPELNAGNDGGMAVITFMCAADDSLSL